MQRWDYKDIVEIVDPKTGDHAWRDHTRKAMGSMGRINQEAAAGWELVTAYCVDRLGKTEVQYLFRHDTLL